MSMSPSNDGELMQRASIQRVVSAILLLQHASLECLTAASMLAEVLAGLEELETRTHSGDGG